MEPILNLTEAGKRIGEVEIIKRCSLSIFDKGCIGLIGSNGSGKSTLLNLIGEITFPTSGSITQAPLLNKFVGFSSGIYGFYPEFNFEDNVRLIYMVKKSSYNKDEVSYYRDLLCIDKTYNKPFKKYSSGMKQKLSIISAFICNPKLILLDEPTNYLDIDAIVSLRSLLNSKKKEACIIVASHVLAELEEVCDQVVFIRNGNVGVLTNLVELLDKYNSLENAYQFLKN